MQTDRIRDSICLNWIAILSYSGSVAVSLAIWIGAFRVIGHFIK
jgi:hypothetical protein